MYLNSNVIHEDDAAATIQVDIHETDGFGKDVFLVTVDKILGSAVVHNKGQTKHTRLSFVDADDTASLETGAAMAVLSFGA